MKRSGPPKRRQGLQRLSKRRRAWLAEYRKWVLAVRARDRHCQWDGCSLSQHLEIHHVFPQGHYPRLRLVLENGLALCQAHHRGSRGWHARPRASRAWWAGKWPDRAAYLKDLIT